MKKLMFCVGFSLLAGESALIAQEKVVEAPQSVESRVQQIRGLYADIENDQSLTKTQIDSGKAEQPVEMKITRYTSSAGELKKMSVLHGGDHGTWEMTYYFYQGEVFFAFEVTSVWRFTGKMLEGGHSEVVDVYAQRRLYFDQGKCIKVLEKRVQSSEEVDFTKLIAEQPNKPLKISPELQKHAKEGLKLAKLRTSQDIQKHLGF